ncbi:hypothetical protein [Phaeodactylibacter sp.]|uniref:hypothetical protein n=1 Tax=Phaeodactylibacter sp. TaxID=1940289 RepID=UPI0025D89D88|nr:hypothetical protein [Phaeodactylibacter sp.]MCI4649732.1 hypothetical protein [Phaeodactylibacter sp.]MCI5093021.1 hypothetical protein [Phaeodactylibacter sp.]
MKNLILYLFAIVLLLPSCDLELGDVSTMASSTANRCINDMRSQFSGEGGLNIGSKDYSYKFQFPRIGLSSHVQGVARLRDWNGKGRMAISDNGSNAGFRIAFQDIVNSDEGIFSEDQKLKNAVSFKIRNEPQYGDHDHPGGMQAQGDVIAIAMEGGAAEHGAVYFLKAEGNSVSYLSTLWLDGSQGEPYQADQNAAATVGFVKLEEGNYLLAVCGRNHGKQGIWFYETEDTEITSSTQWYYIDFYEPECTGYGNDSDKCFVGSGGGLNLVTDCEGAIYLIAMHGTSGTGGKEYEYLQVFWVLKASSSDAVELFKFTQQRDGLGLFATNSKSFRWAGGVYVTRDGRLAIFNTERRRNVGDNDFVDGDIYIQK